jgi:hypothetical protein
VALLPDTGTLVTLQPSSHPPTLDGTYTDYAPALGWSREWSDTAISPANRGVRLLLDAQPKDGSFSAWIAVDRQPRANGAPCGDLVYVWSPESGSRAALPAHFSPAEPSALVDWPGGRAASSVALSPFDPAGAPHAVLEAELPLDGAATLRVAVPACEGGGWVLAEAQVDAQGLHGWRAFFDEVPSEWGPVALVAPAEAGPGGVVRVLRSSDAESAALSLEPSGGSLDERAVASWYTLDASVAAGDYTVVALDVEPSGDTNASTSALRVSTSGPASVVNGPSQVSYTLDGAITPASAGDEYGDVVPLLLGEGTAIWVAPTPNSAPEGTYFALVQWLGDSSFELIAEADVGALLALGADGSETNAACGSLASNEDNASIELQVPAGASCEGITRWVRRSQTDGDPVVFELRLQGSAAEARRLDAPIITALEPLAWEGQPPQSAVLRGYAFGTTWGAVWHEDESGQRTRLDVSSWSPQRVTVSSSTPLTAGVLVLVRADEATHAATLP